MKKSPYTLRRAPVRLHLERLEDRTLPSAGEWLASLSGLHGDTRQDQMKDAAQRLHAAGVDETDVRVIDHLGVDGLVVVQTPADAPLEVVNKELQGVPGFRYVEAYDPLAEPGQRISQFPESPAAEEMLHEAMDVNGPPASLPFGPGPGPTGPNAGPNIVSGVNGFAGIDSNGSFCGCSPPDTTGAAGPNAYIETVNTSLAIYHKDGSPITGVTSFDTFFSPLGSTLEFSDPVIVYNDITQRFFIGMLDFDTTSNSRLDVAISTTNNPTTLGAGDWNFFRYNLDDPSAGFDFGDYPKLGYDADGYVVSVNQFKDASSFDHVAVLAIRNDGTTATGNQAVAVPGGFDNFTFAPARMHDAAPGGPMWFVETPGSASNSPGSQVTVVRMDGVFTASPGFTFTNLDVTPYLDQPSPLGGQTGLGTRMYFSALRTVGGVTHLVAAHSPGVSDASGTRSRVRWYDIDVTNPASPAILQQGEINQGVGIDTWFPDADIAPDGSIGMTFSQSDPTVGNMDMYVTGRRAGDAPGTMQAPIAAVLGAAPLDAFGRAGDYSFTTVDPADGTFWAANEFSANASSPNWATWVQHFTLAGMAVSGSTPADGSTVAAPPASYVVTFSDSADPLTVDASDLTVNGHPADGVVLSNSNKTATFTFNVGNQPVVTQGLQTMAIAADSIARDHTDPSSGIQAFSASFRYDAVPLTVASTNPPAGGTVALGGPLSYVVNFNDDNEIDAASIDVSDLTLNVGTVLSAAKTGPLQATYTIGGLTAEGPLTVALAAGAVTDSYGNPGQAFSASYTLDFGTLPFPAPLTAESPLGSLVYDTASGASGVIGPAGDTDSFTLSVNAGQTITVLVTPAAGLQPTITLTPPSGPPVSVTAPAAGKKALLQTAPATAAGVYTITVGGAGGTTGGYTVQPTLNAALEAESNDGAANDTLATAQNLNAAFTIVQTGAASAQRAAVLGRSDPLSYAATAVATTFEEISNAKGATKVLKGVDDGTVTVNIPFAFPFFDASYTSVSFSSNGLITFGGADSTFTNSDLTSSPALAAIAPYWDDLIVAGKGNNAVVAYQVLGTGTSQRLVIEWSGVSYKADKQARGGITFEAVLGADGSIKFNYQGLATGQNGGLNDRGKSATVGIKAAGAPAAGRLLLVYNNGPTTLVDSNKSVLITRTSATPDLYAFTLAAGDRTTLAVKALGAGAASVDLLNAAGAVVASGVTGPTNLDKLISNFAVAAAGTYYARVTAGGANVPYDLVLTRNAAFDAEGNDTFAAAQDFTGTHGAVGHVTAGTDLFALRGTPVSGSLILSSSKLTLGVNADGSFITAAGGTGIQFLGNEFVTPGTPLAGFTIGAGGVNYTNEGANGTTQIAVTMQDLSSGPFHGVRIVGTAGGLQLERVIAFNEGDEFATVATRLTNLTGSTILNVASLENLDPDQGYPLGQGFETYNDVVLGGQFVRADATPPAFPGGLTIGLGSADARAVVSAEGFDNRDPFAIINSPEDPNGAFADIAINLAFNFGNLGPSQSVAGTLIMTFGRTTAEADATYSAHTAGTLVADEDWYKVTLAPGQTTLHVETSTPSDGAGVFANTLNPHIELYSPANVLLYSGTALADGRNEVINATGLTPGATYRIRITGEAGTSGEYFLDPPPSPAAAPAPAAFIGVPATPAFIPGGAIVTPPALSPSPSPLAIAADPGRSPDGSGADVAVADILSAWPAQPADADAPPSAAPGDGTKKDAPPDDREATAAADSIFSSPDYADLARMGRGTSLWQARLSDDPGAGDDAWGGGDAPPPPRPRH